MKIRKIVISVFLALTLSATHAQPPQNGAVELREDGSLRVWDEVAAAWTDIESFWLGYAGRGGGLTWGRGKEYPSYAEVKEFDTFLVELAQGTCLMEFFHSRWRRANDVRRWDNAFNDYGACPYVFE